MKWLPLLSLGLATILSALPLRAEVRLPAIFSDHAVLQKTAHVPVWGKADPGEKVTVTLDTNTASATAGENGRWSLDLNLKDSGTGPYVMTVEGKNKLTLSDIVVGEVWLASGQSNMERLLKETTDAEAEIAQPENPMIRQFKVTHQASKDPVDDIQGQWKIASPTTRADFSAVAYYFSKKLLGELKVPVGVINSTWGGTPSEAWTSAEALDSVPDLKQAREMKSQFPAQRKAWADAMTAWMKETGREDRPATNEAAFAGTDVDTSSWVPLTLPGEVKAPGLPATGAVWIRQDVMIPAKSSGDPWVNFPLDGYDTVYWNGRKIAQTTVETFQGLGHARARDNSYIIRSDEILPGTNVLAIRLFEPAGSARMPSLPQIGNTKLGKEWLAKAEFEFPSPATGKPAPEPPRSAGQPQHQSARLFNGMINPLVPYALRGVIWYQGESNADRAYQYRTAFPLMIGDWRKQWNREDLPFYFCQLANFGPKRTEPGDSSWAELREAQTGALSFTNTGQALLIELGESDDIHPRNKKDPGERLALIALARDYGKAIPYSGPVFDSMKIEGGKVILSFKQTAGGLVARPLPETYDVELRLGRTAPLVRNSPGSQLEGFAICGEDKNWVWADAKIEGDTVVVYSPKVPSPVAVRYAWADNPTCNLYNGAGLPAVPFRTDDFPAQTLNQKY